MGGAQARYGTSAKQNHVSVWDKESLGTYYFCGVWSGCRLVWLWCPVLIGVPACAIRIYTDLQAAGPRSYQTVFSVKIMIIELETLLLSGFFWLGLNVVGTWFRQDRHRTFNPAIRSMKDFSPSMTPSSVTVQFREPIPQEDLPTSSDLSLATITDSISHKFQVIWL